MVFDFIKRWGLMAVLTVVALILFAGCDEETEEAVSSANLEAVTVAGSATSTRILTQGASGESFTARISAGSETQPWCSFDASQPVTSTSGKVGTPLTLHVSANTSGAYRVAEVSVAFSGGYTKTLHLSQMPESAHAEYDRAWGELPAYREGDGFIYKTYHTTLVGNRYFTGGEVRNYTVCYDTQTRVSQWVAYPVFYALYEYPKLDRVNAFGYDPNDQEPEIPTSQQQNISRGYNAGSYDRGHMLPQATRYNNYDTNRMTYYATNMMPQYSRLNQGIWATLESKVRGWGPLPSGTRYDTLYVVTGACFKDPDATIANANGPITLPSHCWKVLLKQTGNVNKQLWELSADEVKAIGFVFTNDSSGAGTSLLEAACSVQEVERLTGFTFFQTLAPEVAAEVKGRLDTSQWSGIY